MVRFFAPKFYEEGLSIVARDEGTRGIIGALLNDDMETEPPPEGRAFEGVEKMAPGGALLDELIVGIFTGKHWNPMRMLTSFSWPYRPNTREGASLNNSLTCARILRGARDTKRLL